MKYYIGWDVGAWKSKNGRRDSCDAIVVIHENKIVGHYRDNITHLIGGLLKLPIGVRSSSIMSAWLSMAIPQSDCHVFSLEHEYFIAIDTPLGWPDDFKTLLQAKMPTEWTHSDKAANICNSLLFRYTEREKLKHGLSPIVDSIGSQSAKGMVLLKLLGAVETAWGVWKSDNVTLIETYPKACLIRSEFVSWMLSMKLENDLSATFQELIPKKDKKEPNRYRDVVAIAGDLFDAAVCAFLAKAFEENSPKLVRPTPTDPSRYKAEGWIFYPEPETAKHSHKKADGLSKLACGEGVRTFAEAMRIFQQRFASKSSPS